MLTESLGTLRQIAIANLSPHNAATTTINGDGSLLSTAPASPAVFFSDQQSRSRHVLPEVGRDEIRPPPFRRRSTRGNQLSESPVSRGGRLEHALSGHRLETFFVIYVVGQVVYISETVPGKSPIFQPFLIDSRACKLNLVVHSRSNDGPWRIITQQDIDTTYLKEASPDPSIRLENVILMQFAGSTWYTTQDTKRPTPSYSLPSVDSYSLSQVLRLQSSTDFTNDALQSIATMRLEIEALLKLSRSRAAAIHDSNLTKLHILELQEQTRMLRKRKIADTGRRSKLQDSIALRSSLIHSSKLQMSSTKSDLNSSCRIIRARGPSLDLLSSEIRRCQRQITTILTQIYPIRTDLFPPTIRSLNTASNSDYSNHNGEVAAALGYIAHFVFILSHYLAIPLRYPVRPVASKSYILDPISISSTSKDQKGGPPFSLKEDRRYPLFWERRGTSRLHWAVFLLNKDIEQLLQARGLVCGDLRNSLQNLEGLVIWLVSVNEDEDVSLSSRPYGQSNGVSVHSEETTRQHDVNGRELCAGHRVLDPALEITDVDDLLAAQLKTKMHLRKGKERMGQLSEKDDEDSTAQIPD